MFSNIAASPGWGVIKIVLLDFLIKDFDDAAMCKAPASNIIFELFTDLNILSNIVFAKAVLAIPGPYNITLCSLIFKSILTPLSISTPVVITSGFLNKDELTLDVSVTRVTSPEPQNKLASDASIPAPPMPGEPAHIKTFPKLPLWLSFALLGRRFFNS